jgi:DHA3 family macrolide efflux protein-like MFS transporter
MSGEAAAAPRAPDAPGARMAGFVTIWLGQVVSTLGSGLSGFALAVWVYQTTGSATRFALIAFVTMVPGIVLSPFAGALVDRWDRRRLILASDLGAAAATLALVMLVRAGRLELWQIYGLMFAVSSFGALRWPAFAAATTMMVPARHLGRASGMSDLGEAMADLLAPLVAGALVATVGLQGILSIDLATYLAAVAALLVVRIPPPPVSAEGAAARGSLWREAWQGWRFIRRRPGLLALLLVFATTHVGMGMVQVLLTPMILAFASPAVLGRVLATAGLGMLAGSLVMSVWGGPRRRVAGILGLLVLQGVTLMVGGLRPNAVLVAAMASLYLFATPIITGCSQAIWQTKVSPDLQGRVFAVRRTIAWSTLPLTFLAAGPLADRLCEPLMAVGGPLAGSVGRVLGAGKGRGIALLIVVVGAFVLAVVAVAARQPRLRRLESELPDAVAGDAAAPPPDLALEAAG